MTESFTWQVIRDNRKMSTTRWQHLAELARSVPVDAVPACERALEQPDLEQHDRSEILRALGEAARWVRPIDQALNAGREAMELATPGSPQWGEAALTLSGTEHLAGNVGSALDLLREIERRTPSADLLARVNFQQATIQAREGRGRDSLEGFATALSYFDRTGNTRLIGLCHQNLGMVRLESAEFHLALHHLHLARHHLREAGIALSAASVGQSIGKALSYLGDIRGAWDALEKAESDLTRLTGYLGEVRVAKVELLTRQGLYREAVELAELTERELTAAALQTELAELLIWRTLASHAFGDRVGAVEAATRAVELFSQQGRDVWADYAAACRGLIEPGSVDLPAIATRLIVAGQPSAAATAAVALSAEDPIVAARLIEGIAPADVEPLHVLLARFLVAARAAREEGHISDALGQTSQAIAEVGRRRTELASSDALAGASMLLASVIELGLELRLSAGDPVEVVDWVNLCRNRTHQRFDRSDRPLELVEATRRLRKAERAASQATGVRVAELQQTERRLRSEVLSLERSTARVIDLPQPDIESYKPQGDGQFLQFAEAGNTLHVVILDPSGSSMQQLNSVVEVDQAIGSLQLAVARYVSSGRGAESVRVRAERLQELLLSSIELRPPITISPLPQHMSVPWALLPSLQRLEFNVAPTAESSAVDRGAARCGVVLGPGLGPFARFEAESIAELLGCAVTDAPSVDQVLQILTDCDVVHLACHGRLGHRDGRFSGLDFDDGSLSVFDLEGLASAPSLITMSACDAGATRAWGSIEAVGLMSALFSRGTEVLVASTSELPDSEHTAEAFVRLHELMATPLMPEKAAFSLRQEATTEPHVITAGLIQVFRSG